MCALLAGLYIGGDHKVGGGGLVKEGKNVTLNRSAQINKMAARAKIEKHLNIFSLTSG